MVIVSPLGSACSSSKWPKWHHLHTNWDDPPSRGAKEKQTGTSGGLQGGRGKCLSIGMDPPQKKLGDWVQGGPKNLL